jgi:hypothetical protein
MRLAFYLKKRGPTAGTAQAVETGHVENWMLRSKGVARGHWPACRSIWSIEAL